MGRCDRRTALGGCRRLRRLPPVQEAAATGSSCRGSLPSVLLIIMPLSPPPTCSRHDAGQTQVALAVVGGSAAAPGRQAPYRRLPCARWHAAAEAVLCFPSRPAELRPARPGG